MLLSRKKVAYPGHCAPDTRILKPFAETHVVLRLLGCNRLLKHELFQELCSPRLDIAVGIFKKTFDYSQFLPIGNGTEQLDCGPPRFDGPLSCVDLQTAAFATGIRLSEIGGYIFGRTSRLQL